MKSSFVKQIERAHWRLWKAVDKVRRAAPGDAELVALERKSTADWLFWHKRLHAVEVAAAAKKDKGEVLWTIFYPDGSAALSVTRTPNLRILHYERQPSYVSEPIEDVVTVETPKDAKTIYRWFKQGRYPDLKRRVVSPCLIYVEAR